MKTRAEYAQKLKDLGDDHVSEDDVFTSSYTIASFLNDSGFSETVYLIGSSGLAKEFEKQGIKYIKHDGENSLSVDGVQSVALDDNIKAVVMGNDRAIDFGKIGFATRLILEKNCDFYATNLDSTWVTPTCILPGTGSLVSWLSTAVGRQPIVAGKPSNVIYEILVSRTGLNPQRTCMVGDRLDTDILFGNSNEMKSMLVMTGVTNEEELQGSKIVPQFKTFCLGDIKRFATNQ
eukprot:TRINITY_DN2175_c0_g1_i2.p1 TRINITY_DN2175_c0_g1~~TRINITY_DN2175_c0_g1_i2.p1  ORF type:complete len:234 (+),score=48.86 TRINITY_DN2175_c0_g1_i2:238-939(+)